MHHKLARWLISIGWTTRRVQGIMEMWEEGGRRQGMRKGRIHTNTGWFKQPMASCVFAECSSAG